MHTGVASALTRRFAKHYVEMVLVMLAGMAVLAVPARLVTDALWPGVPGDDATLMLGRMAVTMTLPMVPWMRWRGHRWRPCLEMAASMIVPGVAVLAVEAADILTHVGVLMTVEHVAMFVAMFGVMVARPSEYSHGCQWPPDPPRCAGASSSTGPVDMSTWWSPSTTNRARSDAGKPPGASRTAVPR